MPNWKVRRTPNNYGFIFETSSRVRVFFSPSDWAKFCSDTALIIRDNDKQLYTEDDLDILPPDEEVTNDIVS